MGQLIQRSGCVYSSGTCPTGVDINGVPLAIDSARSRGNPTEDEGKTVTKQMNIY